MKSNNEIKDNKLIQVIRLKRRKGTVFCAIPGESEQMLVEITKYRGKEIISVSYKGRYPGINELQLVKHIFFKPEEKTAIIFPDKKSKKHPFAVKMHLIHQAQR